METNLWWIYDLMTQSFKISSSPIEVIIKSTSSLHDGLKNLQSK